MFRTTEVSNPDLESNHLRFITVKSRHLKGRGDICVFVPPDENLRDIPLIILLHGVYGSAWSWSLNGGVHLTALNLMQKAEIKPMIIAMPSDGLWGDGSGYIAHSDLDFERWIVEDVPRAVIENVTAASKNSPMFISGLSMGGFGALRLGVKYADKFSAISAHSAITALDQMPLFVEEPIADYLQKDNSENSVWGLIQKHKSALPPIRFDCGLDDVLIAHNRKLHHQLLENEITHTYEEFPGSHEWSYWQTHIKDSLKFFNTLE